MLKFLKRFLKALFDFLKKKLDEQLNRWFIVAVILLGLVLVLVVIAVFLFLKGSGG